MYRNDFEICRILNYFFKHFDIYMCQARDVAHESSKPVRHFILKRIVKKLYSSFDKIQDSGTTII